MSEFLADGTDILGDYGSDPPTTTTSPLAPPATVAPGFANRVTLIRDRKTRPCTAEIQGLEQFIDTGLPATTLIKQMRKVSRKQNLKI